MYTCVLLHSRLPYIMIAVLQPEAPLLLLQDRVHGVEPPGPLVKHSIAWYGMV